MNIATFKFGDRVVHTQRPDWGHGTITRVETIAHEGNSAQRLHIRFTGAGLKVINTAMASLVMADEAGEQLDSPTHAGTANGDPPVPVVSSESAKETVNRVHAPKQHPPAGGQKPAAAPKSAQNGAVPQTGGWLSDLEKNNPEDVMLKIPEYARDPFRSVWERLESSLQLYRFTKTARGILDWAVAQSGLEDPMSRFNRQELETLFGRWMRIRDLHLFEVLEEAEKQDADRAKSMLSKGANEARQAMRRLYARR